MNYKEKPLVYQLPISLVTKICSYVLYKNFPKTLQNNDVLKLRLTCKLFGYLTPEKDWWEQICTSLDPNTCTFYCYKILDVFSQASNTWCHPPSYNAPLYSQSSCYNLRNCSCYNSDFLSYFSNIFSMLSENLRPSVKISLLRFIAINNYKFKNPFGVLFFQYILGTHIDTKKTTQLVQTLQSLEDQVFYEMYSSFQMSFETTNL